MIQLILWSFFLVPWLSLFLMNRKALGRYMPVALLATVMNTIVYQMAWTYGWWKYKETLFPWDKVAQVHTVYGAFLAGTLWIFRFTYGRFWIYMMVNIGVDLTYAFGLRMLWKTLGITAGGNLPPWGSFALMTFMALLLYLYQMWQEKAFAPAPSPAEEKGKVRITMISRSARILKHGAR
ncbi:hypothetical protein [Paenibacillus mucilaginosus]|uniref:Uncharacterized protein n=1 Tax=Paenibacillus mucilaginosus (strain KNP414) TaxID=1036673 RepID=F8FI29_PAEMK|nr:hypothetical protein [Paenibacillus mucilaginosus]AEI43371.1 hypothetical protein KNP414_04845 [Paenibacillus mucilaginosus KNP414]MCG7212080.1 hypothetical protein [Paenibacillus mucilaginosus]WDM24936.1 hypothetical protein KCX80_20915 [Paenibacillus mucilaginosus]